MVALKVFVDFVHPDILLPNQNDLLKVLIEKVMMQTKQEVDTKALECVKIIFEVSGNFQGAVDTF